MASSASTAALKMPMVTSVLKAPRCFAPFSSRSAHSQGSAAIDSQPEALTVPEASTFAPGPSRGVNHAGRKLRNCRSSTMSISTGITRTQMRAAPPMACPPRQAQSIAANKSGRRREIAEASASATWRTVLLSTRDVTAVSYMQTRLNSAKTGRATARPPRFSSASAIPSPRQARAARSASRPSGTHSRIAPNAAIQPAL